MRVTIIDRATAIYGVGDSAEAARADYESACDGFREVLTNSEPLAPHLSRLLVHLNQRAGN